LAEKHLHGIDSITTDVEAWDTSALNPVFPLVKHCLLEEIDEAFEALEQALAVAAVTSENLRLWPILAPIRDDPRYLLLDIVKDHSEEE
jgi:hypothetical protein